VKALTKIRMVSEEQVAIGRKVGLDLSNRTVRVAAAMIEDFIGQNFWGNELDKPTEKQVELAARFGYDISGETRRVGFAIIEDIMEQLNYESIEEQNLMPGNVVRHKRGSLQSEYVISSVGEDGTILLKGSKRKQAWARNIIKVSRYST